MYLSAFGTGLFLLILGWVAARRRFVFYLLFFIWVSFIWRLASTAYIDLSGPLYSIQLFRDIGGGNGALLLVVSYAIALAAVLIVFRSAQSRRLVASSRRFDVLQGCRPAAVASLVFMGFGVYVASLFFGLGRVGVVPLFAGMERWQYTELYGGISHGFLMEYGVILSFVLGLFYMRRILERGTPDTRFLFLLLGLFSYLFLVGHRFSAFYSHGAAFIMPYGVVALRMHYGHMTRRNQRRPVTRLWLRLMLFGVVLSFVSMVVYAVYISLAFTRDPNMARAFGVQGALRALEHRVLVQQGELWWATYQRVFVHAEGKPASAFRDVFVEPITEPRRNSTIAYLMVAEIGDRAYPTLELGQGYSGGYPEILFELFGAMLGFAVVFVMAYILAKLVYMLIKAILQHRLIAVFLIYYVLYAFLLFHVSGMLNFLVNWKFWVKAVTLALWLIWEKLVGALGRSPVLSSRGVLSAKLS